MMYHFFSDEPSKDVSEMTVLLLFLNLQDPNSVLHEDIENPVDQDLEHRIHQEKIEAKEKHSDNHNNCRAINFFLTRPSDLL